MLHQVNRFGSSQGSYLTGYAKSFLKRGFLKKGAFLALGCLISFSIVQQAKAAENLCYYEDRTDLPALKMQTELKTNLAGWRNFSYDIVQSSGDRPWHMVLRWNDQFPDYRIVVQVHHFKDLKAGGPDGTELKLNGYKSLVNVEVQKKTHQANGKTQYKQRFYETWMSSTLGAQESVTKVFKTQFGAMRIPLKLRLENSLDQEMYEFFYDKCNQENGSESKSLNEGHRPVS